jgi:hypothetical protein
VASDDDDDDEDVDTLPDTGTVPRKSRMPATLMAAIGGAAALALGRRAARSESSSTRQVE